MAEKEKRTVALDEDLVNYLESKKLLAQEPLTNVVRRLLNLKK